MFEKALSLVRKYLKLGLAGFFAKMSVKEFSKTITAVSVASGFKWFGQFSPIPALSHTHTVASSLRALSRDARYLDEAS